jgi:hypothetical protein
MYSISSDRPMPGKHSIRDGLTTTLRKLYYREDSVDIPRDKKNAAYSAAKLAGIKITVRDTGDGKAIVWRTDGPERPHEDIFGQPLKPAAGPRDPGPWGPTATKAEIFK